jgi:hypothetical protein
MSVQKHEKYSMVKTEAKGITKGSLITCPVALGVALKARRQCRPKPEVVISKVGTVYR